MPDLKRYVAALAVAAVPAAAQDAPPSLDELLGELARPDADHEAVGDRIGALWSRSGSAALDLLLRRGREALEEGDHEAAIDHLSALIDHAPDFAEGYNTRATAYYADGRVGEALSDIVRALELEPRHFGALAGLGFVMEDLGHQRDALRAYRAAAELHPGIETVNDAIARLEDEAEGETL